jgi:hypothetical protein
VDDETADDMDPRRRQRLVDRVDPLVTSGRITADEAARLRFTIGSAEFDDVVRDIRVRHAQKELGAAVVDGRVSEQEADELFERLRKGEHSRSLRRRLNALRATRPIDATAANATAPPAGPGQDLSA